ncbi:uncharacterized protein LOC120336021 [Styela clava]
MATTTMEPPLLSYGRSMSRVPRYKKVMKLPKKQPNLQEKRDQSDKPEGNALQKVGAFGVSVKKNQLTTDYLKHTRATSDRQTSPIKELVEEEENAEAEENNSSDIKRLPAVEISIRKKIKRRIMIRHSVNTETLESSDKQVLEDLRNDLRTQTRDHRGEKSILEAIGDPKLRESRFSYEPLKQFLAGNEKPGAGKEQRKTPFLKTVNGYAINNEFPSDIRLMNVTVPPNQKHFNTPDPRFAHSFNPSPFRASSKQSYPNFPKVPTFRQLRSNKETREKDRLHTKTSQPPSGESAQVQYNLSPSSGVKNDSENGRKTEFSLPFISLHMQDGESAPPLSTEEQKRVAKRKIFTQPVENQSKRPQRATRPRVWRPQPQVGSRTANGVKLTPTGKAHLIGPMNKMDMIVEYSKLLQNKVINYEQYVNKLSKLSLHKIDLGNSGLRHYHIVRDDSTGMKHRLARVDIYPSQNVSAEHENIPSSHDKMLSRSNKNKRSYRWTDNSEKDKTDYHRVSTVGQSRAGVSTSFGGQSNNPYDTSSPYKNSQLRMSRVSIGEGISESQYEHYNTGYDVGNDEYLTYDDVIRLQGTDMDRYRHAHRPHPNEKLNYNWSHVPPNTSMDRSGNMVSAQGMSRHMNPSHELYKGNSGKLLPNSREIKKRLNFSYPSYNYAVDGSAQPTGGDPERTVTQANDKLGEDPSHDPDYLAITLDQRTEKAPSPEPPTVTSSLSVHDVTIPTEVKVITSAMPQKNNGIQRKGLALGSKDPVVKEASSSPFKGAFDILNITPVAITSSSAVNPSPGSNKTPYYVSQDDFAATGTDGVLQSHLSTIYKSISKAKSKKGEPVIQQPSHPGKNSPPDVHITKMTSTKSSLSPEIEKTVTENAKLLQPNERSPPPNTPPPKLMQANKEATPAEPQIRTLVVPEKKGSVTSQSSSSSGVSSTLSVPGIPLAGSPPPTAYLIQSREDEITSAESDDGLNDFADVITVNVTNAQNNDSAPSDENLNLVTLMVPTGGVTANEMNEKLQTPAEVAITT